MPDLPPPNGDDALLVLATWMYYKDELTHQQIADELDLSRVAVTRLLQRARREGIVEFNITRPRPPQFELAGRLRAALGLSRTWIVRAGQDEGETLARIGERAAAAVQELIFPGCHIGVGWSSTVSQMAPFLQPPPQPVKAHVHELAGSMLGQRNPYSISAQMARVLGAELETLPVPAVVNNPATRELLLQEKPIREALEHAAHCDIAFVGMGDVGADCTMLQTEYITADQMARIRDDGAVGEILLHYFSIKGERVPTALDPQIITLDWEPLRAIPCTVAVVQGASKAPTIVGAARGGLIDGLITDTETAAAVLAVAGAAQQRAGSGTKLAASG